MLHWAVREFPVVFLGCSMTATGRVGQPPGALATKTLLIVAEPGYGPTPNGVRGGAHPGELVARHVESPGGP
jgi:hypothetical protein